MTNATIQNSRHLLKCLDEEMFFLSALVAQIESLSNQAQFVSTGIKRTWTDIDRVHKNWKQHIDNA